MAKRKRSRKGSRRKLRGFSMRGLNMMRTLTNVGGGFAGAYLADILDKQSFTQSSSMITPAAIIAGGALIEITMPGARDIVAGANGAAGAMLKSELMAPNTGPVNGVRYDYNPTDPNRV
jgi:hypothetical protein